MFDPFQKGWSENRLYDLILRVWRKRTSKRRTRMMMVMMMNSYKDCCWWWWWWWWCIEVLYLLHCEVFCNGIWMSSNNEVVTMMNLTWGLCLIKRSFPAVFSGLRLMSHWTNSTFWSSITEAVVHWQLSQVNNQYFWWLWTHRQQDYWRTCMKL
jgi:hypothetical protein